MRNSIIQVETKGKPKDKRFIVSTQSTSQAAIKARRYATVHKLDSLFKVKSS